MKILNLCLCTLLVLVGSQSVVASSKHDTAKLAHGYQKPGAPVRLTHDYDGKTSLSESEPVLVKIHPAFDMDGVTITVASNHPELLVEAEPYSGVAVTNQPLEIPITVSSNIEGRYYVSVFVTGTNGSHKRSRSFVVPITVGEPPAQKSAAQTVGTESVRVVKAAETIY